MKKIILFSGIVLVSCSSGVSDPNFCECLKKGDELNILQNEIMSQEEVTLDRKDELAALRAQKDSVCEPYSTMDGATAYKLKQECEAAQ